MTIDAGPLLKALLWAGIEDDCPLWQALWEINTLAPDLPEAERRALACTLVRSLLDVGAVELVWASTGSVEPIEPREARRLLAQRASWEVRATRDRQVCLTTTEAGAQRYRSAR